MSPNKESPVDFQVLQSVFSKLIANVGCFVEGISTSSSQGSVLSHVYLVGAQ